MVERIKLLLGEAADNFSDAQIVLCSEMARAEVEGYCHRELDSELMLVTEQIAVIKLNRMGSEGLASEGYSGVSQSYLDGYPDNIKAVLNRKRRISCY